MVPSLGIHDREIFSKFQRMAHGSNRWCFDQSAYQHVSFDRIDWAAMAQQWIKMKETQAIHHQSNKFAISSINEEAPMDLDNDSHRDYNSNWNITQPMSSVPFYPESRFEHACMHIIYYIIMIPQTDIPKLPNGYYPCMNLARKYFTNIYEILTLK